MIAIRFISSSVFAVGMFNREYHERPNSKRPNGQKAKLQKAEFPKGQMVQNAEWVNDSNSTK